MKVLKNNELIEMLVKVAPSLPENVENTIYYTKLKTALQPEILLFTKEQIELREDLNILRMNIGEDISEEFLKDYMESLKEKYNLKQENVGVEYHLEQKYLGKLFSSDYLLFLLVLF